MARRQRPRDVLLEAVRMARGGHAYADIVPIVDRALAMIPEVDRQDELDGLLTDAEHRAMAMTADLWNLLVQDVVGRDASREGDLAEIATDIHHIQERILAQAAGRAFPDRYRLMGERVKRSLTPATRHNDGQYQHP